MPLISYFFHRRDCKRKQAERAERIANLPDVYRSDLTKNNVNILNTPVSKLVPLIQAGSVQPLQVLQAYGKQAIRAHARTNCLTEILIEDAETKFLPELLNSPDISRKPLAGIPVSLKDTVHVEGHDSCIGYSKLVGKKAEKDAPIVRLLKNAGAIPFVKTNVPITLLSFESTNPVFGRTANPYIRRFSPGGSTGGESALIALGGSRIGVGTDVAGSVRIPAHYSGIYTVRCSSGRWPKWGNTTSMAGQEGVNAVYSPMAKSLDDLIYFTKAVIDMRPWKYDHSVVPIPWRAVDEDWQLVRKRKRKGERRPVRWGVMWSDGVVPPSPACSRALNMVVDSLMEAGDVVLDLSNMPSPYEALKVASHLLNADGGKAYSSYFRAFFERNDTGVAQMNFFWKLPAFIRKLYVAWVRYVRKDEIWAGILDNWREKTVPEQWDLVYQREKLRAAWHEYWHNYEIDFLLTVPHALPAIPDGGSKNSIAACGYTFMWNLIDYAAGVLPITHVDHEIDSIPEGYSLKGLNGIAKGAYSYYDAKAMHGLPVGVQVVGQRFEEEKVLVGMQRIEKALGNRAFIGLPLNFAID